MNFVTLGEEGEAWLVTNLECHQWEASNRLEAGVLVGQGKKKDKTIARKLAQHNLKRTKIKEKEKRDTDRQDYHSFSGYDWSFSGYDQSFSGYDWRKYIISSHRSFLVVFQECFFFLPFWNECT